MPKQSWNIKDFSGGVNKVIDKRDIDEIESVSLNNLVSYHPGSLALGGFYTKHTNAECFRISDNKDNTPALYMQPSVHFTKHIYLASVAVYADQSVVITTSDANFPLGIGTVITFLKTVDQADVYTQLEGNSYTIFSDDKEGTYSFKLPNTTSGSGGNTAAYAVVGVPGNTSYDLFGNNPVNHFTPYTEADENRIVLINDGFGKFGYWNLKTGGFVGSADSNYYYGGLLKTLFNTTYLWDWHNINLHPDGDPRYNTDTDTIKTNHAFFTDGVVRVIEDMPETWHNGFHRKPVGFYYIEEHKKFGDVDKKGCLHYTSGWYPLVSHCLSPGQYRTDTLYNTAGYIQNGGTLQTSAQTSIAGMISNSHLTAPSNPNQINICISGKTANGMGDWQCGSSGEHENIGLGISFIYDDINQEALGSFSQESSITNLSAESITISGGEDNCSLLIGYMINPGTFFSNNHFSANSFNYQINDDINALSGQITYSEAYTTNDVGSNFNNLNSWNPRVVGANIYCTKFKSTLDSPLLLGTINFFGDIEKHGSSHSHDGNKAGNWVQHTDGNFYGSFLVESIPIMDYFSKNLYKHNEQHQIWYKTSAIVNRKLYVGNVGYFSDTDPLLTEENQNIELHPDKILMSPAPNKFDTFPIKMGLEIAKFDGQDIICLKNFNNELLVFKTNDLFTIDCSGEDEILKNTIRGKGIKSSNHFVNGDNFAYFFNSSGLYAYDGNEITDLTQDKIDYSTWKNKIYNHFNNISYDHEYNLLLITVNYNANTDTCDDNNNNTLVYNVKNNAFFFKTNDGSYNHLSNGFNAESELYKIGYITRAITSASTTTSCEIIENTAFAPGSRARFGLTIRLEDVGTWAGTAGGSCNAGTLNTHAKFLKILQGQDGSTDKWITLNTFAFVPVLNGSSENDNAASTANIMRSSLLANSHSDYDIENVYSYLNLIFVQIESKKAGTYYNLGTAVDLSALGPPFSAGTYQFAFADDNAESTNVNTALQPDGSSAANAPNLRQASITYDYPGTNRTASVHTITPDCGTGGSIQSGTMFILRGKFKTESGSLAIQTTDYYIIGENIFSENYSYVDESTLSGQSTINQKIVDQMLKGLIEGGTAFGVGLKEYFLIEEASSTTIRFTLKNDHPHLDSKEINDVDITCQILDSSRFNRGNLLVWNNKLPLDASGNSLVYAPDVLYESKDIDFDEPNVRKKVYKIYITYTGGDGNIKCEYQVNQSGTWVTPTVLDSDGADATTAGYLNTSSTQTRAELKLGSGGNNVYSVALKLSGEGSSSFEINDISIVYRKKSIK